MNNPSPAPKIPCIAIDDEPIALTVIARFCERHGGLELATYSDPTLGLEAVQRQRPAIVFLDIEMRDMNGLRIARLLPPQCCVIFTTAYTEYAIHGFDLDAVDYLHKPFAYERFATAVGRALRRLDRPEQSEQPARTIVVKQEYDNILIPTSEILYIEAMENYVKIHREGGVRTVSRINLKGALELLSNDGFVRIHRSYVVARSKVVGFNKRRVLLSSGVELPVGQGFVEELPRLLASQQ